MKNPTKALTLSLFPGLGHIYFGNMFRGVLYLMAVMGLAFVTVIGLATNNEELGHRYLYAGTVHLPHQFYRHGCAGLQT